MSSITAATIGVRKANSSDDAELFWCMVQGKEYGPVKRPKLIDWVASGRLIPEDQVKVGRGSYVAAGEIPGLFTKRRKATPKNTTVEIATISETEVMDILNAPTRKSSMTKPSAAYGAINENSLQVKPTPVPKSIQEPKSFDSDYRVALAAFSPPKVSLQQSTQKRRDFGWAKEWLTGKPAIAFGGTMVFALLTYFALPFLSFGDSANVRRFKELQGVYLDLARLRNADNAAPDSFLKLNQKIDSVAKKVAVEVEGSSETEQKILLSLARQMEELSKEKLGLNPSDSEVSIGNLLAETGKRLRVL